MNLFDAEELGRISKAKETNDKLEEFFNDKRAEWNKNIDPLFKTLTLDFKDSSKSREILDGQSLALSFRQMLTEQINFFLNKRSRETTKHKKLKHDKFLLYAVSFGVKTNMGEKIILIDGHLAENDRCIELIDSYVDFLRTTAKNLESFSYTMKNMIELLNYFVR